MVIETTSSTRDQSIKHRNLLPVREIPFKTHYAATIKEIQAGGQQIDILTGDFIDPGGAGLSPGGDIIGGQRMRVRNRMVLCRITSFANTTHLHAPIHRPEVLPRI